MASMSEADFAEWVAEVLDAEGPNLVDDWIDGLQHEAGRRLPRLLPKDALRNHIPPVLRAVAEALRTPLYTAHDDILGHLRLHAQLRRSQGYDVQELLSEFEELSERISELLNRRIRDAGPEVGPTMVASVMTRLFALLRAIGFVTVGVYRDLEEDERSRLAEHLETFGRSLAHELRTPLSTVQLGLETIRGGMDPEEGSVLERSLNTMERALARSTELLDDIRILALSKGRGPSHRRRVASVVHDVLEELSLQAEQREVKIINEVEDLDALVDETVAQLALINLVSNGIKYADQDRSDRWVRARAELNTDEDKGHHVVLEVADNGVGVPEEVGEQIFRRHFRAHPQLAQGVGLGLAITRQLVDQSGGKLTLSSEPGGGSRFRLSLPAFMSGDDPVSIGDNELLQEKAEPLE